MFITNLKLAWRNLSKGRMFSLINLFGLSLGISICLLIMSFVQDELSFDKFHDDKDSIYRAWVKEHYKGDIFFNTVTPYLLGSELKDNFPEVEAMSRYMQINSLLKQETEIYKQNVHLVEPEFFKIFNFPLNQGSLFDESSLLEAIITPEAATKYFGSQSPINQNISLQVGGKWTDYSIQGVLNEVPSNSSFQFDILIPFSNTLGYMSEGGRNCWTCVMTETYVKLNDNADGEEFATNVAPFIDNKVSDIYKPGEYLVGFQPITDLHLNSEYPAGIVSTSDVKYSWILSSIAFLILLLACINFISLAIGRSVSRAKEVGVRKVSGASKKQLMLQFWSEALVTVFIAMLLGIVLAKLFLPVFNQLADKDLNLVFNPFLLISLISIVLLVALLAGIYPALVLSSYKPVHAIQGSVSKLGSDRQFILKGLVGFQFGISLILVIGTLIMYQQMHFLQNKNLGFNKEHILAINYQLPGSGIQAEWEGGMQVFQRIKEKLTIHQEVVGLAISSHTMGAQGWVTLGFTDENTDAFRNFKAQKVDENYLSLYEIPIIEGRDFLEGMGADNKKVIINQTMAERYNLDPVIGSRLPGPFKEFEVIGLTDDFNFSSLHNPVEPLVMTKDALSLMNMASDFTNMDNPNPKISVKLASSNLTSSLNTIKTYWNEVAPEQSFDFSFIDDNLQQQYLKEKKMGQILSLSTLLAIIIACLGLFGISVLTVAYRTKEIGIRKVLGASSFGILEIISKDYLKLILVSVIVASPIAWWIMNRWLQDFTYNVGVNWWVFLIAYGISIILAMLAISSQSLKAAYMNPVDSLRNE